MAKKKRSKKKQIQIIDLMIGALALIIVMMIIVSIGIGRKSKKNDIEELEKAYITEYRTFKALDLEYYTETPDRILYKKANSKNFYSYKSSEKSFEHLLELAENEIQNGLDSDYTYSCISYESIDEIKNDKNAYIILDFQDDKKDSNYVVAYKLEDQESILIKNLEYYSFMKFKISGKDVSFERYYDRIQEDNFINIKTAEELKNIDSTKNYKLANDIDFENTPLLLDITYRGILDGNGYSLRNIKITDQDLEGYQAKQATGMIARNEGIIRNLKIDNIDINISNQENKISGFGIIVGENYGAIKNCSTISGNVKIDNAYISGIAYDCTFGEVSACTNKLSFENAASGIVTSSKISKIEDCINEGNLTGETVAGIVISASKTIKNCTNTGNINAIYQAFGVAVSAKLGIENCVNEGNVVAEKGLAAGLLLAAEKEMVNCKNTGSVIGNREVAGIAITAGMYDPTEIKNCNNEGTIKLNAIQSELGYYCISGVVCEVGYGNIRECSNTGKLEFEDREELNSGMIIARKTSEVTSDENIDNVYNVELTDLHAGTSN